MDQVDGNDRANSPGCEESDANKKENPKLRLPTCSDMICGYACLKGILDNTSAVVLLHYLSCYAAKVFLFLSPLIGFGCGFFFFCIGTAAMRNTKRGSWYIEALTSVFAEDARNVHVADMLVKVGRGYCALFLFMFCLNLK